MIASHAAGSSGGAQFYMPRYQINVTGSGTASPTGVVFPGAYSAADPGILSTLTTLLSHSWSHGSLHGVDAQYAGEIFCYVMECCSEIGEKKELEHLL